MLPSLTSLHHFYSPTYLLFFTSHTLPPSIIPRIKNSGTAKHSDDFQITALDFKKVNISDEWTINNKYLTAQCFATVHIQQKLKEYRTELLSDKLLVFDDRSLSDLSI